MSEAQNSDGSGPSGIGLLSSSDLVFFFLIVFYTVAYIE